MGNCHALYTLSKHSCATTTAAKHRKVLRVVKMDGKMLEFSKPLRVENLSVEFSGSVAALSPARVSSIDGTEQQKSGIKRIKMVVTKRQLRDLLSKQISVEDFLLGTERKSRCPIDSPASWKPKLESIPEVSE